MSPLHEFEIDKFLTFIEIVINSTRSAQHFALHAAGIALSSRCCFWFLVT